VKIFRWDKSGLKLSEIVLLMAAAGDELPDPLSKRVDVSAYTKKLLERGSLFVVLSDNGDPAGIMGFYANDQETKSAFLSILSLLPEFHNMGTGRKLMEILVSECKKAGMNEIFLKVSRENSDAIAYYEAMGFRTTSSNSVKLVMTMGLQ